MRVVTYICRSKVPSNTPHTNHEVKRPPRTFKRDKSFRKRLCLPFLIFCRSVRLDDVGMSTLALGGCCDEDATGNAWVGEEEDVEHT